MEFLKEVGPSESVKFKNILQILIFLMWSIKTADSLSTAKATSRKLKSLRTHPFKGNLKWGLDNEELENHIC